MSPPFRMLLLTSSALVPLGVTVAWANPLDPNVVAGSATVSGEGTPSVLVNQSTDKAIIDWRSFDIGADETTTFAQPSVNSVTLNRVTGGLGPSEILGHLSANGKLFVINPDGILFGAGAVVDTAGLVATTNDISNENFMAGRYDFDRPGRPDASIVNLGTITANNSGFAALVAPGVRNDGVITARLGHIGLAAANEFSLDFYGDELIKLGIDDEIANAVIDVATGLPLDALVENDGTLSADGGSVQMTAATARAVVDSVINNEGVDRGRQCRHAEWPDRAWRADRRDEDGGRPDPARAGLGPRLSLGKEPRRGGRHADRHRRGHRADPRQHGSVRPGRRRQGADRR